MESGSLLVTYLVQIYCVATVMHNPMAVDFQSYRELERNVDSHEGCKEAKLVVDHTLADIDVVGSTKDIPSKAWHGMDMVPSCEALEEDMEAQP